MGPPGNRRTLLVRIGTEMKGEGIDGFVVTFDDVTELLAAQRKAAWSDVARRIAHEIKNPLTPIQLAAERLKRRFTKEIQSDPVTFAQCADTIVRHVGDIGRMVDEFSAFARMPQPVIKREDIGRLARESLVLQRQAHPEISWTIDLPDRGPMAPCDRRLVSQALTNLLMNAADAAGMRARTEGEGHGAITVSVAEDHDSVTLSVSDDGVGLPTEDRDRLTEPYVTHKPKGTGLGLAIVKKIMEDHGGRLLLEDRICGPGAVARLRSTPKGTSCTLNNRRQSSDAAASGGSSRWRAASITESSVGQSICVARLRLRGRASSNRGRPGATSTNPLSSNPRLPARPNICSNSSGSR